MSNKEKHICGDCIHDDVCEWAVSNENMFICGSFIDKKVLENSINVNDLKEFINAVCFSKEWVKYRVDYGARGQIECILSYINNAPTVTIKEWKEEMPIYIKDAMLEALRPQGEADMKGESNND